MITGLQPLRDLTYAAVTNGNVPPCFSLLPNDEGTASLLTTGRACTGPYCVTTLTILCAVKLEIT